VGEDPALAGDRFARGLLARLVDLRIPDRRLRRVLSQQPAVAVEQREAVSPGQAAQERGRGLGGVGVQTLAQRPCRQRGGVQRGVHGAFGRGRHDAACAHRDDRGGHRRKEQRRQRYRELARHLTSCGFWSP
jgi:hypothetical protein